MNAPRTCSTGLVALLLLARCAAGAGTQVLVTQVPARAGADPVGADRSAPLPPGSRLVLLDPARPAADPLVISRGLVAAGRPDLSDDARRVLFVAQRAIGGPFQVWEADLAGGEPRQVTRGTQDCREALYLSTLFRIDAEKPMARLGYCRATAEGVPALFTCLDDGGDEQRITYAPRGAQHPLLLGDGRLLFETGGGRDAGPAFFSVNPDGTDVQAFAAAGAAPRRRTRACETRARRVLWAEESDASVLVGVDPARSLRSRQEFVPGIAGRVQSLAELDDSRLLVCWSSFARPSATFELGVLDPGRLAEPEPLFPSAAWHELDALPVRARAPRPGRSSVVDPRLEHGFLYCLDAGAAGADPRLQGTTARACSVEILTPDVARGTGELVLGSGQVESDGSIYLRVPARTPLRMRLLDAEGRNVGDMQSWIWLMPRESRGCIGCHEDPELTPPNRFVKALRRQPGVIEGAR